MKFRMFFLFFFLSAGTSLATAVSGAPDITSRNYVWDIAFPLEKDSGTYVNGWHLCRPSASNCTRAHRAVDLYATPGTPVYAVADGVIHWRQTSASSGWSPVSGSGYSLHLHAPDRAFGHFYGHFGPDEPGREAEAFAVNPTTGELWKTGDQVTRGQLLGFIGTSGATASGPHLHFEIRSLKKDLPIDDPGTDPHPGRNYGDPNAIIGSFEYLRYDPFPSLQAAEERNDYPAPQGDFTLGDFVEVFGVKNGLNVRGPEPCDSPIAGAARPLGSIGRVVGGPVRCPAITPSLIWRIQWEDCTVGWSSQLFLRAAEAPAEFCEEEVSSLIIDNDQTGFHAGSQWKLAGAADSYNNNFRYRQVDGSNGAASWSADLPYAGDYQVYAWWSAGASQATVAQYTIVHADGVAKIPVDQTGNGGRWNSIGSYRFDAGMALVKLDSPVGGGGYLIADAVRFVALDRAPPSYGLTIETIGGGIVERDPGQSNYYQNSEVTLTAISDEGFEFLRWEGDLSGNENPVDLLLEGDVSITAVFARTYGAWQTQHFTEEERAIEGFADPESDPFSVGIPNLLNYAFGLIPRNPDFLLLPRLDFLSENLFYRFRRLPEAADLAYVIECSNDLIAWSEWIPEEPEIIVSAEGGSGMEEVKIELAADTSQAFFVRVRVERIN